MAISALLDANVLYPAPVRDLLLHLATLNLFQPKWSIKIHEEWVRNLLENRPDLEAKSLENTLRLMNKYYPDALVTDFEERIDALYLPDNDDRHVLAAAIHAPADYIVTENIKDFPEVELKQYRLLAVSADDFINLLTVNNDDILLSAFNNQRRNLSRPPQTEEELLRTLNRVQLNKSADRIRIAIKHRDVNH